MRFFRACPVHIGNSKVTELEPPVTYPARHSAPRIGAFKNNPESFTFIAMNGFTPRDHLSIHAAMNRFIPARVGLAKSARRVIDTMQPRPFRFFGYRSPSRKRQVMGPVAGPRADDPHLSP